MKRGEAVLGYRLFEDHFFEKRENGVFAILGGVFWPSTLYLSVAIFPHYEPI